MLYSRKIRIRLGHKRINGYITDYLGKKTDEELKKITDDVVLQILKKEHLKMNKIILYGPYVRGNADGESDIDIMVLCDNDQEKANEYSMEIFRQADKVAFENDDVFYLKGRVIK